MHSEDKHPIMQTTPNLARLSILATIILLSSSRTVWSYEIHIYQMAMDSFPFTWIFSSSIRDKSFIVLDHINNKQELLTFCEHLGSSSLCWWGPCCSPFYCSVLNLFCVYVLCAKRWQWLCIVHFILPFRFVLIFT